MWIMNNEISRTFKNTLPRKRKYTAIVEIAPDPEVAEVNIANRLRNYEVTNIKINIGHKNITAEFKTKKELTKGEKRAISFMMHSVYKQSTKTVRARVVEHRGNGSNKYQTLEP